MNKYLFALLLLALGNGCYSQEFDDEDALLGLYGDEDMISIATGNRQPIAKAPAVASVITANDIRNMGATDIDDVLESVPGLHVGRNFFYNPIYIFRGMYSRNNPQALVLVNGISIGNILQGDRGLVWGGMPVEAISRIEIIRGPGSAVYGADAFAGVINIITKTRDEIDGTELALRGGSFSTRDASLLHGATWNNIDIALMLEYHRTDGHGEIIEQDAQSALDLAFGTNASVAPGPVDLERNNWDLRLDIAHGGWRFRSGLQQRRDFGAALGIVQAMYPDNTAKSERYSADLSYDSGSNGDKFEWQAQLSHFRSSQEIVGDNRILPPGTNFFGSIYTEGLIGNPEAWEKQTRANISGFYNANSSHQFRAGLGYLYADLYKVKESKNFGIDPATNLPLPPDSPVIDVSDTPFVYLREDHRESGYLFLQYVGNIAKDWELTLGVRYDDYSDFGSTTNPRAALVWSTTYKLTTKLLYGEAFRAPAFAETRAQNNPAVLGNPDLDPELMRSTELVFDYQMSDNLRLSFNLFDYQWQDIIDFYPIGGGANLAQNGGEQNGDGFELEFSWEISREFALSGNYSYVNPEESFNGVTTDAANAPEKQLFLKTTYHFSYDWTAYFQTNWVMDRAREAGDLRSEIDDYNLSDIAIGYNPAQSSWEMQLAIRNLFDSDAREPNANNAVLNDYPLSGRSFLATFRYGF